MVASRCEIFEITTHDSFFFVPLLRDNENMHDDAPPSRSFRRVVSRNEEKLYKKISE